MKIIVGLLITGIFYYLASDILKKHSVAFYVGFYTMILLTLFIYTKGYYEKLPDELKYLSDLFQRGVISTSTFIIVMYVGVVKKHNKFTRRYLRIRGEMSIIACLMALTHNILFGITYFIQFFKNSENMLPQVKVATILTLILISLMLPLFITSFICVRKRMNNKSWKNLQRLAYPFFILIYIHVMLLFSLDVEKNFLSIIIYTLIYVTYVVLRIDKYLVTKSSKKFNTNEGRITLKRDNKKGVQI